MNYITLNIQLDSNNCEYLSCIKKMKMNTYTNSKIIPMATNVEDSYPDSD